MSLRTPAKTVGFDEEAGRQLPPQTLTPTDQLRTLLTS